MIDRLRRGVGVGAPPWPAQVLRFATIAAGGIVLGIGTSSHPPAFARVFAHVWGVATLVVVVLLVVVGAQQVTTWLGGHVRSRRDPPRDGRG